MRQTLLLLSACAVFGSCQETKKEDSKDAAPVVAAANTEVNRADFEKIHQTFDHAFPGGDSAAVAAMYTSDAMIFPPNAPQADAKTMGSTSKMIASLKPDKFETHVGEVSAVGDKVVISGTWVMNVGGKEFDKGKFLEIFKKEDGNWKMWRDMWNSDNPLPAPSK